MMDLQKFAELVEKAYKQLNFKSFMTTKTLWESFHCLEKKVSLAEFKILLKILYDSDIYKYEMSRGSSVLPYNKKYGVPTDWGLLCYFKLNEKVKN